MNEVESLKKQYLKGGIGYGTAKELLFDKILNRFSKNRKKYFELLEDRSELENLLSENEGKPWETVGNHRKSSGNQGKASENLGNHNN